MSRKTVKHRVGPALHELLQPGDRIVAGFVAYPSISPNWDALWAFPSLLIAGLVSWDIAHPPASGARNPTEGLVLIVGPQLVSMVLRLIRVCRPPLFIAVSEQQFICYYLSRIGSEPVRPRFCTPLTATRLTRRPAWILPWRSVRFSGAGTGGKDIRLYIHWTWRQDLRELLAAVQAGGGFAETRQPGLLAPDGLAWPGSTQG
jgi:hypothetical protein